MSPKPAAPLTAEHALLGFLRQGPMHGYEIFQRLHDPDGPGLAWRMKQPHLYALLARLEAEGFVAGAARRARTRPPRRPLRLTERGRRAFLAWLRTPVDQPRRMRQEFLLKLYFARREGLPATRRLLTLQRGACRAWLKRQQADAPPKGARSYPHLVHAFRTGQIRAMLAWLDECERSVAAGARTA